MSKYSIDLKLKIINKIKNDNVSFRDLERKYNINHSIIIDWYKKYEKNGENAFLSKKQKYVVVSMMWNKNIKIYHL